MWRRSTIDKLDYALNIDAKDLEVIQGYMEKTSHIFSVMPGLVSEEEFGESSSTTVSGEKPG